MGKYIIIGSLLTKNPLSYGGTTIAMEKMVNYFRNNKISYLTIQTNSLYFRYSFIANYIIVLFKFIRKISAHDIVIINATASASFSIAPVLYVISKICACKFVFRKFAGSFSTTYENQNKIVRYIFNKTILKSDLLFFETKAIVKYFKEMGIRNVHWLPNTREYPQSRLYISKYRRRFVFISAVKRTKGIDEIVKVINRMGNDYVFDIYGTIDDRKYTPLYFKQNNVKYFGPLNPENLLKTIEKYDVIVLPTYHPGEGYPGILIDGYSLGKPCITTNWQSLPEIVDQKETGLLIDVKSDKHLLEAMKYFNIENYAYMSEKALQKFQLFENNKNYSRMIDLIHKKVSG